MSIIAERVSAGIALLDEKVPNWRDKIDLSTLDLRNTDKCVLGQIFKGADGSCMSGYFTGCEILDIMQCSCCSSDTEGMSPVEYGFDVNCAAGNVDEQFGALQCEWESRLALITA